MWEKIEARVNGKKEEAAKQFKLGQYGEANKVYLSAAEQLEEALEDLPLFKKEISQLEASIFNNIAFCYGKDQHHRKEIEYTTKVLDRALYMDNASILVKAYLRRGLAYEHQEKYKLAANDLRRVREMEPYNKQAATALTRCLKYIE